MPLQCADCHWTQCRARTLHACMLLREPAPACRFTRGICKSCTKLHDGRMPLQRAVGSVHVTEGIWQQVRAGMRVHAGMHWDD